MQDCLGARPHIIIYEVKIVDYMKYLRDHITSLRIQSNVTEKELSYGLGHSHGYINSIANGKSMPSMKEFFAICEYFDIPPALFLDPACSYPAQIAELLSLAMKTDSTGLDVLIQMAKQLEKAKE